MEMNEIIEQAERNIRTAVTDYGRHVRDTHVLRDVSDTFIARLARDSSYAKQGLRELFSQSPVWDSKLDAMVINGTRTHDPNLERIRDLAYQILDGAEGLEDYTKCEIVEFFANPGNDRVRENGIKTMNLVAPKAYAPGKKPSRVFKAVCQALGIADETSGSEFQRLYAQFADELNAKKISFKLFVSINPAHFLTMSNPKGDSRGETLTSCHSFNSTQYGYNSGCAGYARDQRSFIVFTVADPSDRESLNNRKTTRQVFAYRPGSGILLQSRFYNTSGGVYGAAEDSKLYRDLIQREISMIERVPNLWKTAPYRNHGMEGRVTTDNGFGGYPDWEFENFDGKVSIRADSEEGQQPLSIGAYGLCVCCGTLIKHGVYCGNCNDEDDGVGTCERCGELVDFNDLVTVRNSNNVEIMVCEDCLQSHCACCSRCGEYYPLECVTYVHGEQEDFCDSCLSEYCEQCYECDDWHLRSEMSRAINENGDERWVCESCRNERYLHCDDCGDLVYADNMECVYVASGYERFVCDDCIGNYEECEDCGRKFRSEDMQDGRCPHCFENREEESA